MTDSPPPDTETKDEYEVLFSVRRGEPHLPSDPLPPISLYKVDQDNQWPMLEIENGPSIFVQVEGVKLRKAYGDQKPRENQEQMVVTISLRKNGLLLAPGEKAPPNFNATVTRAKDKTTIRAFYPR